MNRYENEIVLTVMRLIRDDGRGFTSAKYLSRKLTDMGYSLQISAKAAGYAGRKERMMAKRCVTNILQIYTILMLTGGMPEMVFEYILRQNGIDPSEVNIDQSIDFGATAAAFSGGQGEFTVELY